MEEHSPCENSWNANWIPGCCVHRGSWKRGQPGLRSHMCWFFCIAVCTASCTVLYAWSPSSWHVSNLMNCRLAFLCKAFRKRMLVSAETKTWSAMNSMDVRWVLPALSAMAWQVLSEMLLKLATKQKLRKEVDPRELAKARPVLSLSSVSLASNEKCWSAKFSFSTDTIALPLSSVIPVLLAESRKVSRLQFCCLAQEQCWPIMKKTNHPTQFNSSLSILYHPVKF